jgi:succinate dehydrogenase/fumarate reductase flavoprotein subunit
MKNRYNTLIIGSGCAGFNAADRLFSLGVKDIALVTEGINMGTSRNTGSDKQTYYKLSLCGDEGDSVRSLAETLHSGGGVMGEHALCEAAYSVRCFMRLVELSVPFPCNEYGEYAGYKTDHDPRSRATSSGPLTSKYMTEALEKSVKEKNIEIIDGYKVIKILTGGNEVCGIAAISKENNELVIIECQNLILCTGGPASVYENTVYPDSQRGATGLAVDAGAALSNMEEWQYGIASTDFKWNLSGSYQQVLPRYISVDEEGREHEFLCDALTEESLSLVFLKGYQWPFDTRKINGSSKIDILVSDEIKKGRRVYLDFTRNPKGLENDFGALSKEAYDYLDRSGVLFGTPFERLEKMNFGAVELYRSHGIDLEKEYLRISVCAQHCNGGVLVDENWQSTVKGLYCAGEAAGTFGVYRPGGSALNSTQVGSLRAAEHIARSEEREYKKASYSMPNIRYGKSNLSSIENELRHKMSSFADFDRSTDRMKELFARTGELLDNFFEKVCVEDKKEIIGLFELYDTLLTQRAVLSAMIYSAENIGTHGAAIVDKNEVSFDGVRKTRTVTDRDRSYFEEVSDIPRPELWFETLLAINKEKRQRI